MHIRRSVIRPILLLSFLTAIAVPASAQDGYMFKQPLGSLSLRIGAGALQANGDLFTFFTDTLTLERSDFKGPALGADIAIRASNRIDVQLGASFDRSEKHSEYRYLVDQDDNPIEQTTELMRAPITASAKFYLVPRGRKLGQHAWVPTTITPYVGVGAGVMIYRLEQTGDFVDYQDSEIFTQTFTSSGAAFTSHATVGAEWWVRPSIGINAEGRYLFGSAGLDPDFAAFDRIDLRGFQFTTGISLRFHER
jgi:hypothetical protein